MFEQNLRYDFQMSMEKKPFPVRLPADLHQALKARADESPGVTMNDLVCLGVRNVIEGAELIVVTDSQMTDASSEMVASAIMGDIGALKGTARHFSNLGRQNLSALLYSAAAERIAATDPKDAAKELVHTAHFMERNRPIAIALLRRALQLNPTNEIAKNRLGQFLYFDGSYEEAVSYLAQVKDRDNHAKLFHGLASLHLANAESNRAAGTRARDEIVTALETWAFGSRDPLDRERWLRQVRRLRNFGSDVDQAVDDLVAYANDNSYWDSITEQELQDISGDRPEREDHLSS
jgi:tetratricopeptide (TPR) repeat protein